MKILTGTVHTSVEGAAVAEAVAFDAGRVVAVGRRDEVMARAGAGAAIEELGARVVVPGFVDPHHHLSYAAVLGSAFDVGPGVTPTVAAMVERVRTEAARVPEGEWVVGFGYHEMKMDRAPTVRDLDEACPDKPVLLVQYSCHEGMVNSRALELAGITAKTPDPHGGRIERDRAGHATGRLIEVAMGRCEGMARASLLRTGDADALRGRFVAHQEKIFAAGITRIADACVPSDLFALYRQLVADGALRVPTVAMPFAEGAQIHSEGWLDQGATGEGTDPLTVGPAKWILDGAESCAICMTLGQVMKTTLATLGSVVTSGSLDILKMMGRAKVRRENGRYHTGLLFYAPETLNALVSRAMERGLTTAVHAIGNEAIGAALDAVAAIPSSRRRTDAPPPRIEHATFITPELARRAADLGIILVVQPMFISTVSVPAPPKLARPLRLVGTRTMLDAGAVVAGSSDYPVDSMEPLAALRHAVTRRIASGLVVEPEEAITPTEWLTAYTRNAARAAGCLDRCGTIEPGKRADFTVLSADPLATPCDLDRLSVRETILAGESVYRAGS